ncbi:flavin reductase family protein [Agromyces sp. SYSU T00194]|uniref:flavin reductase family protein n=1 Tax=Agromyces chitinivorans TaxID=3158560 RepID=UPI00339A2618
MRTIPITERPMVESAFGAFPSGIAAITAVVDGEPVGFVSTSFTVGISFEPPQVLFSAQRGSRTWPVLRRAGRLGVSVLAQGHEAACMQLASRSRDRFAGLALTPGTDGALTLDGAVLTLECSVRAEIPSGDHDLVVLDVHDLAVTDDTEPLVYHGRAFRSLLSATNAAA